MSVTQQALREKYSAFYRQFHVMHAEIIANGSGNHGHGPDHDMLVAGYCLLISEHHTDVAEMAWVAAHLHSIDRFYGEGYEEVVDRMLLLVSTTDTNLGFDAEEIAEIKRAVIHHDQPNEENDSLTLVFLKDADRLANVMPYVIARSGQFRPNLPIVELGLSGFDMNPNSSHRSPRSIHDDLLICLEWHPDSGTKYAIRSQVARELGEELFVYLRDWFKLSDKHMKLAGL